MRRSTLTFIVAAQSALVACNQGIRKYEPMRRPPVAKDAPEASKPNAPAPPEKPSQPAAEVFKEIEARVTIGDRPWCSIRKAGYTYLVDRYTFNGGETATTTFEQIAFTPNRDPLVKPADILERWIETGLSKFGSKGLIGIKALGTDEVQASSAFSEQGRLFNDMAQQIELEVGEDKLGDNGAVRVSIPGQSEQILFNCQDFSPTFVSVTAKEAAAEEEKAVAVPPAPRGSAQSLRGPLVALAVDQANLPKSRWCSYQTVKDDVVIGLLQFGPQKEFTSSHLRASALKVDQPGKKVLAAAALHAPISGSITGVKANQFMTSNGGGYRIVRSATDARAIVLDSAAGNAAPTSTAEVYFECTTENDPVQSELVTKNITQYMDQRYK